jgi:hypothetical protein
MALTGQLTLGRPHRGGLTCAIRGIARTVAEAERDPAWRYDAANRLADLDRLYAEHIRLTEGTDGLYAEVLDGAPRLARYVRLLIRDHVLIGEAFAVLREAVDEPAAALRRRTSDLEALWGRHRQRGADLLHAAYGTDIGGET